ncbi:MAG TPA: peroxiredoxin [archaeon]|nr:peroxiredoxin [archaeon]
MLGVGEKAPEFLLSGVLGKKIRDFSLADFRGKWVVLFFYPLDFSFVCPTEIRGFSEKLADFKNANAALLAVSVDSVYSHREWVSNSLGEIGFPLLSDLKKNVCESYEVLKRDEGVAFRATFIIDPEGIIQSAAINNLNVGRSVSETFRVLKALQTGGLCAVEWKPGEKNLKPA